MDIDSNTETQETQDASTEVEASPKPSIDDVVSTRMQEADNKADADKPADDSTKPIEKKVETKGERIQRLYREEKQRNETLAEQVTTLQDEIKRINERLEAGTINPQQAQLQKQEAVQEAVELNPDLVPYEKDLTSLFNRQVEPLKRQIDDLLAERNQRQEAEWNEKVKANEQKATDLYAKQVEANPHLFLPKNEKGEFELKPELDVIAMEIFNKYNRTITGQDGQPVTYNTLFDLETLEDSLDMLFSRLDREFDKAEKAKVETEKVTRIKAGRVEMPASRNSVSRKMTIDDIVEKRMKQFAT